MSTLLYAFVLLEKINQPIFKIATKGSTGKLTVPVTDELVTLTGMDLDFVFKGKWVDINYTV